MLEALDIVGEDGDGDGDGDGGSDDDDDDDDAKVDDEVDGDIETFGFMDCDETF